MNCRMRHQCHKYGNGSRGVISIVLSCLLDCPINGGKRGQRCFLQIEDQQYESDQIIKHLLP